MKDKVNFFCVYIQEAHPVDWWQLSQNLKEDVVFNQPASIDERAYVAEACMLRLDLAMPMLLDDMDNSTDEAYAAMPERLYVVDTQGRIAFKGAAGPWGFDVAG
ncbi:MAG: hypothetical protein O7G86_04055 [Gammaproteobacteria bacterium]|nr:hypothetical protein [Gammaproteobacteria bacterium]